MTGPRTHLPLPSALEPRADGAQPLQWDDHAMKGLRGAPPCGRRSHAGSGDLRAQVPRPGSTAAAALPSRVGRTLRWPDGRITTLDGQACGSAGEPA